MMSPQAAEKKSFDRRHFWAERAIAIVALINLVLVFFDASYVTARSLYLHFTPAIVQFYDPVKSIHPDSESKAYLNRVRELEAQVLRDGITAPQIEPLLVELRRSSQDLNRQVIGTVEHQLQNRTGANTPRTTFEQFWSQDYLAEVGWQSEITFWNRQIQPLLESSYYRDVNPFGYESDYFWLIDLPFMLIFAIDIILRVRAIYQRYPELSWLESLLRRWYDLFLLLPAWRWLRVIPVTIRLHHGNLVNLEPLRAEAQRDFVIGFAAELTEMVGIHVIDQLQNSIQNGQTMRWLLYPETRQDYVQINGQNEVQVIASRFVEMSVNQVLPKVQTDIQNLVHYSVVSSINQLPVYHQIGGLPGTQHLSQQLAENLGRSLSQLAYQMLVHTLEDPVALELTTQLTRSFRDALEEELQKKHNTKEIESLLVDMLEEIKINYVRGISEVGIDQLVDEAEQLHHRIKR